MTLYGSHVLPTEFVQPIWEVIGRSGRRGTKEVRGKDSYS